MRTAKLQRICRFCMGSRMLSIEQGHHLQLPRHRHICKICRTGTLNDERHLLLECHVLADVRTQFSQVVAHCSGVVQGPAVGQLVHHSLPFVISMIWGGCQFYIVFKCMMYRSDPQSHLLTLGSMVCQVIGTDRPTP